MLAAMLTHSLVSAPVGLFASPIRLPAAVGAAIPLVAVDRCVSFTADRADIRVGGIFLLVLRAALRTAIDLVRPMRGEGFAADGAGSTCVHAVPPHPGCKSIS